MKDIIPMFTFGKYRGQTFQEVADKDPSYIVWAYENVTASGIPRPLFRDCQDDLADQQANGDDALRESGDMPDEPRFWGDL